MTSKSASSGIFALPAGLHVDIRLCETGVNVTLRGEIDVHTAPILRERLAELVDQGDERVVVHLDGVSFMDSTGLGVLVGAHRDRAAAGSSLELVCTDPRLLRILHLTGLHRVLTIHDGSSA